MWRLYSTTYMNRLHMYIYIYVFVYYYIYIYTRLYTYHRERKDQSDQESPRCSPSHWTCAGHVHQSLRWFRNGNDRWKWFWCFRQLPGIPHASWKDHWPCIPPNCHNWALFKIPLLFHYAGWLIDIPIPYWIANQSPNGWSNLLQSSTNGDYEHCSPF